jgi:hypothetical protein
MQLGLSYDVMRRWTGNATSLVAQRSSFVPRRPLEPGNPYPDAVTVVAETTSGVSLTIPGGSRRNLYNWCVAKLTSRASHSIDGVVNMEYLEAAYYAAIEGRRVTLP